MSKTLVLYYSHSGLTKRVAEAIAKIGNFDLKEIELEKPISTFEAYAKGFFIRNSKNPPKLKKEIDISDYDTIYVGTPIWFYTTTPAIRSFMKDKDFTGKNVVAFCTDGGNCGNYFKVMEYLAVNANFGQGKEFQFVNKMNNEQLIREIENWLKISS